MKSTFDALLPLLSVLVGVHDEVPYELVCWALVLGLKRGCKESHHVREKAGIDRGHFLLHLRDFTVVWNKVDG